MKKRENPINALSAQEKEFLEKLLEKEYVLIMRVTEKMLGESYLSLKDEALSELHLLMIRKIKELMRHESPEKWVVTAAKYIALHVKTEQAKYQSNFSDTDIDDVLYAEDVFEMALYNIWLENDVYSLLKNELTIREAQVFELMFEQKLSCIEIMQKLGVSESTVWNIRKSIKDKYCYAIKNKLF